MAEDVQSFSSMLRTALGDRLAGEAEGFVDMVADDGVMEFPYTPKGLPARLEGRTAIADHLTALGKMIAFERIGPPRVYAAIDPDVTIIEFEGSGRGVTTGVPYQQRYVSIITTRDGKIIHYRDYWNPLVLLRALKGSAIDDVICCDGEYKTGIDREDSGQRSIQGERP